MVPVWRTSGTSGFAKMKRNKKVCFHNPGFPRYALGNTSRGIGEITKNEEEVADCWAPARIPTEEEEQGGDRASEQSFARRWACGIRIFASSCSLLFPFLHHPTSMHRCVVFSSCKDQICISCRPEFMMETMKRASLGGGNKRGFQLTNVSKHNNTAYVEIAKSELVGEESENEGWKEIGWRLFSRAVPCHPPGFAPATNSRPNKNVSASLSTKKRN